MKQAVIADTGPLYAAVDPDDQYHRRARRELKRLVRDRHELIIAYPTLLESYTLLLYRLGREIAKAWLDEVLTGAALVNLAREDYRDAANKVRTFSDQKITLFDAAVAVLGSRLGIKVWTYDHHFDVMRTAVWR
jgi:predicted nucleic acid-binding protein